MRRSKSLLLTGFAAILGSLTVSAADAPSGPAYQIILRSRHAQATPNRTKESQTGGGSIVVDQPEQNTIMVTMGGTVVAGSDCKGSAASIDFQLEQDLDIQPARSGVRPPRIGLIGQVTGTLVVTEPPECCLFGGKGCEKGCGSAEQGTGTACLTTGGTSLLSINVEPSSVACGNELSINHRAGPVEAGAGSGCYHLSGCFRIAAAQGKGIFHRQYALADFDPAPQLDGFWSNALKPFRAVPRRDFGFRVVLRVIEDSAPAASAP